MRLWTRNGCMHGDRPYRFPLLDRYTPATESLQAAGDKYELISSVGCVVFVNFVCGIRSKAKRYKALRIATNAEWLLEGRQIRVAKLAKKMVSTVCYEDCNYVTRKTVCVTTNAILHDSCKCNCNRTAVL